MEQLGCGGHERSGEFHCELAGRCSMRYPKIAPQVTVRKSPATPVMVSHLA
jgi:hypothetical protein